MENLLLIFICLTLGFFFQKSEDFPPFAYKSLNQFVIYVSLPAMALYYIPKIQMGSQLLFPLGVAWIGFLMSYLFFSSMGRWFGWSRKLTGCLMLTAGLGNTSFLGFPIIQALYGEKGVQTAIIVDQPGTFVVMATFGILTATVYAKGTPNLQTIGRKILFFPPFIAFSFGCLMILLQKDFSAELQSVFQKLGSTVTPVALIAVGLQLKIEKRSKHWRFLFLGLAYKLLLTPAIFFVLYRIVFGARGLTVDVSIMESAMAPMITSAILASSYGLKPKLSSMMIGVGIPLSFVTLAFWYFILNHF